MEFTAKLKSSPWLQKLFHRLSIRKKIFYGYGLALGVAIVGTLLGLIIGNIYFQQARQKMVWANQEGSLLSSLQGTLLEIQVHQHELLSILVQQQALPQENADLEERIKEAETLFSQLQEFSKASSQEDLQVLVSKYDHQLIDYLQQIRAVNQQISLLSSQPGEVAKAQELIGNFNESQTAHSFYKYSHDLSDLAKTVLQLEKAADSDYSQAAVLQTAIILGSIILSMAIATILALYTSRIIAQPINAVTYIAQKVTQESNFNLEVPVTTQDEIGSLANSLNQLIHQVKYLLEVQQTEAQTKLIQSEKMSSLGNMLAGIAHEINNPINFISGNLEHAQVYFEDLLRMIQVYQDLIPNPPDKIQVVAEEIDLEFLEVDLPKLFNSIMVGVERTKEIIRSLKDFSRVDEGKIQLVDLHNCLDSTLLILNNRFKKGIDIVRNYGEIPAISGYTGLLYQVFMNLLSNASDALEEKFANDPQFCPKISIITELQGNDWVLVRITDNGPGITAENQRKIFEMFFTTKPRGVGTGLGLAITHQIVVEKHHGKINCHSELDQGTEFAIALPVNQS